ncbi:MAG: peptidylprolyl isomerase [Nanoarchaeota archaeon]|nr:peptidylprolyl isomerase [Nanoarchaeota archaeon]
MAKIIGIICLLLISALFISGCSDNNIKDNSITSEGKNMIIMETSKGVIKIQLNEEKAPITTKNFKSYVESNFYDGTIFHRVMPNFMIQCGGFNEEGNEKETTTQIKNEAKNGLLNKRGTLAMARTSVVDSASSQFFINLIDNDFLDHQNDRNYGYAVFGEVVEGMDIVDIIASVPTGMNGPYGDWPKENVVITKVYFE